MKEIPVTPTTQSSLFQFPQHLPPCLNSRWRPTLAKAFSGENVSDQKLSCVYFCSWSKSLKLLFNLPTRTCSSPRPGTIFPILVSFSLPSAHSTFSTWGPVRIYPKSQPVESSSMTCWITTKLLWQSVTFKKLETTVIQVYVVNMWQRSMDSEMRDPARWQRWCKGRHKRPKYKWFLKNRVLE